MNGCAFTVEHYCWILDEALRLGHRFCTLDEYWRELPEGRTIILRHDIDLSIIKALEMAEEEAKRDIRATFFMRVHARDYNPFSRENFLALRRLLELGCEIALQHEVGVFPVPEEEEPGLLAREVAYLEAAIGRKIVGATVHMPKHRRLRLHEAELARSGIEYDGSGKIFNDGVKFVSDSNQSWKEDCLCRLIGRHEKLYVNIHPFWWFPFEGNAEEIRRFLVAGG